MKKLFTFSYQQKLKLLGWAVIPILIICYQLAFTRTVTEYKTYNQHRRDTEELSGAEGFAHKLQLKSKQLDTVLYKYTLDTTDQNRNLLDIVSEFCHDYPLQLKEYKPLPTHRADSIATLTRIVTVEGEFKNCLYLVYALEQQYQAGRVSSVQYKSYKDLSDTTTHLLCTVYIQNILQ